MYNKSYFSFYAVLTSAAPVGFNFGILVFQCWAPMLYFWIYEPNECFKRISVPCHESSYLPYLSISAAIIASTLGLYIYCYYTCLQTPSLEVCRILVGDLDKYAISVQPHLERVTTTSKTRFARIALQLNFSLLCYSTVLCFPTFLSTSTTVLFFTPCKGGFAELCCTWHHVPVLISKCGGVVVCRIITYLPPPPPSYRAEGSSLERSRDFRPCILQLTCYATCT